MRWFRSLGAIALGFALLLSAATGLTGVAVYLGLVAAVDHQVDLRLMAETRELLGGEANQAEIARRIARKTGDRASADIGFLLRDARGRKIAGNIDLAHPLPYGLSTVGSDVALPGFTRGRAWVERLRNGSTLTLLAESEPIDRHDRRRLSILATGFGAVMLILVVGIFALASAIQTEIGALRGAAEAIIDGDLRARVPVLRASSAFGRLAITFNRMLDRIGELMASMRSISNDVAHDLRTPLARLHGRLAALAAAADAAPFRADIDAAVSESEEILAMFSAILRIAEIEGADRRAGFVSIDLAARAADIAEGLRLVISESGRRLIEQEGGVPVPVEGDPRLLAQLLVNLIENAVTHTPPGTTIRLSVERLADAALLRVTDDGPGIPAAERPRALRRFGRLEASRHAPGHGLGLPLVAAIARLHRGSLTLADAQPGLAVEVRLPLAPGMLPVSPAAAR